MVERDSDWRTVDLAEKQFIGLDSLESRAQEKLQKLQGLIPKEPIAFPERAKGSNIYSPNEITPNEFENGFDEWATYFVDDPPIPRPQSHRWLWQPPPQKKEVPQILRDIESLKRTLNISEIQIGVTDLTPPEMRSERAPDTKSVNQELKYKNIQAEVNNIIAEAARKEREMAERKKREEERAAELARRAAAVQAQQIQKPLRPLEPISSLGRKGTKEPKKGLIDTTKRVPTRRTSNASAAEAKSVVAPSNRSNGKGKNKLHSEDEGLDVDITAEQRRLSDLLHSGMISPTLSELSSLPLPKKRQQKSGIDNINTLRIGPNRGRSRSRSPIRRPVSRARSRTPETVNVSDTRNSKSVNATTSVSEKKKLTIKSSTSKQSRPTTKQTEEITESVNATPTVTVATDSPKKKGRKLADDNTLAPARKVHKISADDNAASRSANVSQQKINAVDATIASVVNLPSKNSNARSLVIKFKIPAKTIVKMDIDKQKDVQNEQKGEKQSSNNDQRNKQQQKDNQNDQKSNNNEHVKNEQQKIVKKEMIMPNNNEHVKNEQQKIVKKEMVMPNNQKISNNNSKEKEKQEVANEHKISSKQKEVANEQKDIKQKEVANEYKNGKQKDVVNHHKDIKQKGAVVTVKNEQKNILTKDSIEKKSDDRRKRRRLVADSTEIDLVSNSIPDKSTLDSNAKLNNNLSNLADANNQQSNSADFLTIKSTVINVKPETDNFFLNLHGKLYEPHSSESATKSKDNITTSTSSKSLDAKNNSNTSSLTRSSIANSHSKDRKDDNSTRKIVEKKETTPSKYSKERTEKEESILRGSNDKKEPTPSSKTSRERKEKEETLSKSLGERKEYKPSKDRKEETTSSRLSNEKKDETSSRNSNDKKDETSMRHSSERKDEISSRHSSDRKEENSSRHTTERKDETSSRQSSNRKESISSSSRSYKRDDTYSFRSSTNRREESYPSRNSTSTRRDDASRNSSNKRDETSSRSSIRKDESTSRNISNSKESNPSQTSKEKKDDNNSSSRTSSDKKVAADTRQSLNDKKFANNLSSSNQIQSSSSKTDDPVTPKNTEDEVQKYAKIGKDFKHEGTRKINEALAAKAKITAEQHRVQEELNNAKKVVSERDSILKMSGKLTSAEATKCKEDLKRAQKVYKEKEENLASVDAKLKSWTIEYTANLKVAFRDLAKSLSAFTRMYACQVEVYMKTTTKGHQRPPELPSGSLESLVAETISWAAKNNNRELEGLSLALQGLIKTQEAKCKPQWLELASSLADLLETYE
ncbi:2689_t:CDS:10 [Ambispora gerdemannii]|uniref:2689_t:CDS:1 n=1 Tax=Ambispora gerdemannii TaxID=144530 RepID=A0A9N8YRS3_9GLOM|nr:2689_t:CDS:10 [Ambispora gerdemannii]